MLRIGVCDDGESDLRETASLVRSYLEERPALSGRITACSSGQELLEAAEQQGGFDLCLLDIVMPGMDGIRTGRALREMGGAGEIIYLTVSNDYAADSYDVRAFFYLLKPVRREKLFQVLDQAVEQIGRRRGQGVLVSTRGGTRHLRLEDIRYVERVGRSIRYYCAGETVDSLTIRTSFREGVAPLLADRRFCLCGACFVLNLQRVAGVEARSALLDDGSRLTLPRTAAAAFKKAWGAYWLEGGTPPSRGGEGARHPDKSAEKEGHGAPAPCPQGNTE